MSQQSVFPPGYPTALKKYGHPPPFPPGYPPEQYEKYGYPPSTTPACQNHSATSQQPAATGILNDIQGIPILFPWGPGNFTPIAGNVYYSGGNINGSGTQTTGDVKVGNQY